MLNKRTGRVRPCCPGKGNIIAPSYLRSSQVRRFNLMSSLLRSSHMRSSLHRPISLMGGYTLFLPTLLSLLSPPPLKLNSTTRMCDFPAPDVSSQVTSSVPIREHQKTFMLSNASHSHVCAISQKEQRSLAPLCSLCYHPVHVPLN